MKTLKKLSDYEYRSKEEINGWPLIHINFGTNPETGRSRVAKGIVAIGNFAVGIVAIGALAFGVVTLAGIGIGIVSLAGIAIGIVALGAIGLGYEVSIGAIVQSSKFALGVITLDAYFFVWPFIFVAFIALVIWSLSKVKDLQL